MAASIESLFSELSGLEDPIEELKNLRTVVLATPLETLKETVPGLQLEIIFSLLNTNDRCVQILEILILLSQVSSL